MGDRKRFDNTGQALVAVGDSHAFAIGDILAKYFNNVVNLGKNGLHFHEMGSRTFTQIPENSIVLLSMGTNDVQKFASSKEDPAVYARNLIRRATELQDKGCIVVVLGLQTLERPYTGNPKNTDPKVWNPALLRLNEAIEREAEKQGVIFNPLENVPRHLRSSDNLHYSPQGYSHILNEVTKLISLGSENTAQMQADPEKAPVLSPTASAFASATQPANPKPAKPNSAAPSVSAPEPIIG